MLISWDHISPEEIEALQQRAQRRRQAMPDWLIVLIVSLLVLTLFVPMG